MLIDPPRLGRSKSAPYLGVARLAVRVQGCHLRGPPLGAIGLGRLERLPLVEGTFQQVKWRVRVNYSYEEITARSVICFRGLEPKTK